MRHTTLALMLLLVAGLAPGCDSADGTAATGTRPRDPWAAPGDKTIVETEESMQAMQDYAYTQRAAFLAQMRRELTEVQQELDQLDAAIDRSGGVASADAKARLEVVRETWAQAKLKLDHAESATESTWDEVKGGFRRAHGELKDSFEKTRQWLSDKLAP
ncbi:MAG: hypothetical protein HY901_19670 [Deltaproteobacteria bacterium]|nr:hypothetical protein [Deltaproteobacteria bacterium]